MKKIYTGLYAAIALLIIFVTISVFVYGIISDSDRGYDDAKNVFSYFAKHIIELSEKSNFAEDTYNNEIYKLADELEIKAFVISTSSTNVIISWPKDSDIIAYDDQGQFLIQPASFFVKNFSGKLKVKTLQNFDTDVTLTVCSPTLKGSSVYIRIRNTFFILLALLILTIIMILLNSLSHTKTESKVYNDLNKEEIEQMNLFKSQETSSATNNDDKEDKSIDENDTNKVEHTKGNIFNNILNNVKSKTAKNKGSDNCSDDTESYTLEDLDNLNIGKQFPYEANSEVKLNEEPKNTVYITSESEEYTDIQNEKTSLDKENDAIEKVRGLYSPITGISWQEYLPEYLESELRRAASSEQDIALVIMRLNDFTLESLIAKKISTLLIDFIKFRDMIFEFGDDGFAAILQDTNLDEAMKKAEEIYNGTKNILNEYDISEPISIGITTRTSRLISSDRMIEEAHAAVNRAFNSNEDPIVAFRVNPEKYREFICEN